MFGRSRGPKLAVAPYVPHDGLVPSHPISVAADVLGVSDDTVRRWIEAGRLEPAGSPGARRAVDGASLARLALELAEHGDAGVDQGRAASVSARNRMRGIVTRVVRDTVMAQVDLVCGPYRVVSLMSTEAAEQLALEPGVVAIASVKSTNVVVELP